MFYAVYDNFSEEGQVCAIATFVQGCFGQRIYLPACLFIRLQRGGDATSGNKGHNLGQRFCGKVNCDIIFI